MMSAILVDIFLLMYIFLTNRKKCLVKTPINAFDNYCKKNKSAI